MSDFAYTTVTGRIKPLLAKIQSVGIPTSVTTKWLKSIGFTSSNDASLLGVLKQIDFVDVSGSPTDRWKQYRGPKSKRVLGAAIREGYADLYAIYPDADKRTRQELEGVFTTSTKAGKDVISRLVSTFRSLADEADFGDSHAAPTETVVPSSTLHAPVAPSPTSSATAATENPSLHIDIQIHISPDSGPEQIDQIFASMAKHLYGKAKSS
ncbi:DUF5343 domain-containing protein [soil metagenome]